MPTERPGSTSLLPRYLAVFLFGAAISSGPALAGSGAAAQPGDADPSAAAAAQRDSAATDSTTTPTSPGNETRIALDHARQFTRWFYAQDLNAIYDRFAPEMKAAMSLEALSAFRNQVEDQVGAEMQLLDESMATNKGLQVYTRRAKFEKFEQPIDMVWVINPQGLVAGFVVRPTPKASDSQFLDYEPQSKLRLPVDGKWHVFWGGRTIADNYHAIANDQRFALDLVIMQSGTTHDGDGTANEQYYAFGEKVLAPAAGLVIVAADSIPDNPPGQMNPDAPAGNYVVIDHENGEFSFLCHFKATSLTVKAGDRVEKGQILGECGNSGNSSEPHLHYHMQNTSAFGGGDGLPARFHGYKADGAPIPRGEPKRGQVIEHWK